MRFNSSLDRGKQAFTFDLPRKKGASPIVWLITQLASRFGTVVSEMKQTFW